MLNTGLRTWQLRSFHDALTQSHATRTIVSILDQDERVLQTLDDLVVSGQVDVAMNTQPDRLLQLEIADIGKRFRFVPRGVSDTHMFADNMIRVEVGTYVDDDIGWVDVPVFTGPFADVDSGGETIRITAVGKESLALSPNTTWQTPGPFGRNAKVTDVIRAIMRSQGERRFDIPDLNARLHKPLSTDKSSEAWKLSRKLARQVDRQLFYDGAGRLRLRAWPKKPVWTFRAGGNAANITTPPATTFDISEVRNTILVLGPKPDGKEPRPRAVAVANRGHNMSPWSLARRGEPRYMVETIEVGAKRHATLQNVANRTLDDRLRAAITVAFEAIPIPHLEPGDEVALVVDGERTSFRLQDFSIPLGGDPMTVGYHRRSPRRGKR